ncbi:HD domain-containing protein [bacterium]|nr:HD domain-containing protein [bacterium]
MITLKQIKQNPKTKEFINQTEVYLDALSYTDHGERHLNIVADRARKIARHLNLSVHEQELAAIAGYCHDMGNFLGRTQHHYWSSFLFSQVFMSEINNPNDITSIMQAIASHDKNELKIVNKITACLILADKSDVHRTRVKEKNMNKIKTDIHNRVNYSVTKNDFKINKNKKQIILKLNIDTKITKPMDYFEIFLERMTFCKEAAKFLKYDFVLIINNFKLS